MVIYFSFLVRMDRTQYAKRGPHSCGCDYARSGVHLPFSGMIMREAMREAIREAGSTFTVLGGKRKAGSALTN